MLTGELLIVAALLSPLRGNAVSNDCRRNKAIEFWSGIVCSMVNCKTVNMYRVLDADGRDLARRCFDDLVYDVARRCETAIVSSTHALQRQSSENASTVATDDDNGDDDNDDDDDDDAVRPSSIRGIIFDDYAAAPPRSMLETDGMRRDDKQNTWRVHVILASDVHSFERISRSDSTFEWNTQDWFVVLITDRRQRSGSDAMIDGALRTLWRERGVQNVLVSETSRINRIVRTYNPFARVNQTAWGKIEVVKLSTAISRAAKLLSNLTRRRMKNLNGYELRVGVFDLNEPIQSSKSNGFSLYSQISKDFDVTMLETVAEQMNFTVRSVPPTDDKSFGYELPDGTYVGAIGDVVHGRTDVCFKSFFVKKYSVSKVERVEFTTHVELDGLCVITPKAFKIPKWLRAYHLFSLSIWLFSIFTNVLTCITWYYLQVLDPERTREKRVSFFETVYRLFLLNAGCPQELPSKTAERILLTGVFLASITMVGVFNGILYDSFAHDMYYKDIDSLEDLDASGLPVTYNSFGVSDLFGPTKTDDVEPSSPIIRNLKKKTRHDHESVKNAAYYRNVSALLREHYFPVTNEEFTDANSTPLLHLVKECPRRFYLSYLLPKNSILRERINVLIGRLNEAGFSNLWNGYMIRRTVAEKKLMAKGKRNEISNNDDFVAFKLSDVQTSFYMLLVGLWLSTMAFLHERGWLRLRVVARRNAKLQ